MCVHHSLGSKCETLCYDSLLTLWVFFVWPEHSIRGSVWLFSTWIRFFVPTVCSDMCSESCQMYPLRAGSYFKEEKRKNPSERVCESERHPTYPPPSSCSSWHRSIPVRLLISHEPRADCVNSAKWHPFPWSYSSFTQMCRQSQEHILCTKALIRMYSHTHQSLPRVSYITVVYNDRG